MIDQLAHLTIAAVLIGAVALGAGVLIGLLDGFLEERELRRVERHWDADYQRRNMAHRLTLSEVDRLSNPDGEPLEENEARALWGDR